MDLELKEIELAAKRLEPTIHRTKIESSKTFSDMTGGEIYLKFENQQKTGSFKIRGACNKISNLTRLPHLLKEAKLLQPLLHLPATMHKVLHMRHTFTTFPQLSLCRSLLLLLR